MQVHKNTTKPKKSCYIINEKAQIGEYHKGLVYFFYQDAETKEIKSLSMGLINWCIKWIYLNEISDIEGLKKAGVTSSNKNWS